MESRIGEIIEEQIKAGIIEDPEDILDDDLDMDDISFDDEDDED